MSVVLFTMDEPMYMPSYIEPVVRSHRDLIDEVIVAPHPSEDLATTAKQRYEMFGPRAFLRYGTRFATGKALAVLPSALQRRLTGQYHSVRSVCAAHEVPVTVESDVNDTEVVSRVESYDPDLLLSISCQQKLASDLLSLPDRGCINLHGSLLPRYRGRATAFWVLYHDEDVSGVTAHYMTDELDGGEIVMQRQFDIGPDDTMDDVYRKIVDTGSEMAVDLVDRLREEDPFTASQNDTSEGEYRSLPTAEDRREFLERGNDFV